jgi:hypothetical protein
MLNILKKAILNIHERKSFKTQRKLVIIESDDWGSTRTRNKAIRDKLNALSPSIKQNPYIQYDSIAAEDDLENLFDALSTVKDSKGRPACLTANVCTANPDFKSIKASGFRNFVYKDFKTTLNEYAQHKNLFEIWQEGIAKEIFSPELHGREHLHALAWLAELRAGNDNLLKAFDLEVWGIPYKAKLKQKRKKLQAALDKYQIDGEDRFQREWINESSKIFKDKFRRPAKSFIAPSYIWKSDIYSTLVKNNIKTIQGIKLQFEPKVHKLTYKNKMHYTGQVDKATGLIFTGRNAFFEPFSDANKDWAEICYARVNRAFNKNQPAIIGSHRINFIGRLDTGFRDRNLNMLKVLLKKIVSEYPEVEFISSGELADIISSNYKN